jgi:hypothetical protein
MSPFSPAAHPADPGSLVLPSPRSTPWLEGPLSTPVVSSKGTPISTRRRGYGWVDHVHAQKRRGPGTKGLALISFLPSGVRSAQKVPGAPPRCQASFPIALKLWLGWACLTKKVHGPWHQGVCFDLPMIFCA